MDDPGLQHLTEIDDSHPAYSSISDIVHTFNSLYGFLHVYVNMSEYERANKVRIALHTNLAELIDSSNEKPSLYLCQTRSILTLCQEPWRDSAGIEALSAYVDSVWGSD